MKEGPSFYRKARIFITPWFLEFNSSIMLVTMIHILIRLSNLPLPFFHHKVLDDIGKNFGSFKKMDTERKEKCIFTFACICVKIGLIKGPPHHIFMKHKFSQRIMIMDYENMAFRCYTCFQTGHHQD